MLSRIVRYRSLTNFVVAFGVCVLLNVALDGRPEVVRSSVYAIGITVGLLLGRKL